MRMATTEPASRRDQSGSTERTTGDSARRKILTLDELAAYARQVKERGQTTVLAHGTFDLLHMGHVRHLEQARGLGDVLLVTLTADELVNKGPGRPVFTGTLRAEMVAALGYVDRVAINPAPTAENVIKLVKPDVYVKGSEYALDSNDITGKILDERNAVEAHGGSIHFTYDITFSSSSLINRHLDVFEPKLRAYLETVREKSRLSEYIDIVESVKEKSVLLVGDAIIDEYHYVSPMGKSPKENLIPTLYRNAEIFAGGVIAAANHVANFCRDVEIVTWLGDDGSEDLVRQTLKPNVKLTVIRRPDAPTTRKRRFVDPDYLRKLFEVYVMDDTPLAGAAESGLLDVVRKKAAAFDVVILTDFGHGTFTPKVREELTSRSRFLAVNAQSNSANHGFNLITKYSRADYICIDAPEARLAVHDPHAEMEVIAGERLPALMDCSRLILTHGRHGCITFDREAGVRHIPAFTGRALDTMGAGDAFLAITAPLVAAGHDMEKIGFIGNAVGAIKVGIVGHRQSVEKIPLLKYLATLLK
jgi:rfaE bifunctional protein kinase chain/domain/rfaE bifunctional protein nucleotidyltransferase chain/domain